MREKFMPDLGVLNTYMEGAAGLASALWEALAADNSTAEGYSMAAFGLATYIDYIRADMERLEVEQKKASARSREALPGNDR